MAAADLRNPPSFEMRTERTRAASRKAFLLNAILLAICGVILFMILSALLA